MAEAIQPMQAISEFIGEGICEHEEMVDAAIRQINAKLPKLFSPDEVSVGGESHVFVDFPNITQAALIEVVLKFRRQGWKADWTPQSPGAQITVWVAAKS